MTKGEETKGRIIEEAAPLFNKHGFEGCSIQDIMEATSLGKGGIYRHFSSKEELAAECFQYSWAAAAKSRSGDVEHVENAVEKLRYLINRFVSAPSSVPGGCPLMNAAIDTDDGNPRLRALAEHGLKSWKSKLLKIVQEGQRQGQIDAEANAPSVVNTIIANLEGSLMISRLEHTAHALHDAKRALDALLDSIAS